jgi:hypothetical protein
MGTDPCGFCGLDSKRPSGCRLQLSMNGSKNVIKSTCQYMYMPPTILRNLEAQRVSSKDNICTNLPMHCPFCPQDIDGMRNTVWSYSFIMHLWEMHSSDGQIPRVDASTQSKSFITKTEEVAMDIIPTDTDRWRSEHHVPDSDEIDVHDLQTSFDIDEGTDNVDVPPHQLWDKGITDEAPQSASTRRVRYGSDTLNQESSSFEKARVNRRKVKS